MRYHGDASSASGGHADGREAIDAPAGHHRGGYNILPFWAVYSAGDVNCDGAVNAIDATLLLQRVAALLEKVRCPLGGDVNHDGMWNAIDAAVVLQYSAGLVMLPLP